MDDAAPNPADIPAPGSYHWTPALQRAFLESLATTGSVKIASTSVGMSPPWPLLGWGLFSLMLAGILLAVATLRTRSLFLSIGLHAGWIFGQQALQWMAKFRIKPPDALLPWVGQNVVSGAVPTGLIPAGILLLTMALTFFYLRYASASRSAA